jgi:predicted HTH transcriptional regulator
VGSGFDRMREELFNNKNPALDVSATNFYNICFFKRVPDPALQKLTTRQLAIYYSLLEAKQLTKREIALGHQLGEDTAMRELKVLMQLGFIEKQGEGKDTCYVLASNIK